MQEKLQVQLRDLRGKRRVRRLRRDGLLPGVLYGQGQEVLSLVVPADAIAAVIRHGTKLIQLEGAIQGSALIHDVQWDPFATEVLHVDLLRIKAGQRVEVTVAVEVRGVAPGLKEGGIVEQPVREVEIDVPATAIPERLHLNINELGLGESMLARQIEDLPADARLITDAETVLVHCVQPAEEVEEEAAVAEAGEPELIGGKADETSSEEEKS